MLLFDAMNMRCFNPQFFIASKVGDEALEAGEGRSAKQFDHDLSVVIDALRVLCGTVPTDQLLPGDRLVLDRLEELGRQGGSVSAQDQNDHDGLSSADVDAMIRKLRRLRQDDPRSADDILRRLIDEAQGTSAQTGSG